MPKEQRRGRKIAMSTEELDGFLAAERTCRVATVRGDGTPHVVPLWFVWDGNALWLNSVVKSQRWTDLSRNPAVSVVVDAGTAYGELRGVELVGTVEKVGDAWLRLTPSKLVSWDFRKLGLPDGSAWQDRPSS
jgi:hypothetical protein